MAQLLLIKKMTVINSHLFYCANGATLHKSVNACDTILQADEAHPHLSFPQPFLYL